MVARALGWEMRVGIVQFIKGKWQTGERNFFRRFPDLVTYEVMGEGFTWDVQDRQRDLAAAARGWARASEMIADPVYDFVLLDELNIALRNEYLDIDACRPRTADATARQARLHYGPRCQAAVARHRRSRHRDGRRQASVCERLPCAEGHRILMRVLLVIAALLCCSHASANEAPRPVRIVSLNPCLDQLLVELAPREHIVAISHYSRDPFRSTIAELAQTLPITYETAEEIVALRPDLVLAGRHSAIATRNALTRVGIPFELFDVPLSVEESHALVRRLAALLHVPERGAALIARIDAAIVAARPS